MRNLALEYDDEMVEAEVAEAEAPAPRMIIVDKKLAEALAILGINVIDFSNTSFENTLIE